MSLNSQILLSLLTHEASAGDLSQTIRVTPVSYSATLAETSGMVAWSDSRTLAGSNSVINTASLIDERGTVTLTSIRAVYLKNTSAAVLTATPAAAGAFGGTYTIRPGGVAVAVSEGSPGMAGGTLTVAGSSGQTYDVLLIGEGSVS